MKIKDKILKKDIDVCHKDCHIRPCYWPRPDPGVFTQGKGYKSRGPQTSVEYICGTRAIRGCPDEFCNKRIEDEQ